MITLFSLAFIAILVLYSCEAIIDAMDQNIIKSLPPEDPNKALLEKFDELDKQDKELDQVIEELENS